MSKRALIVVDVQGDFVEGGHLAVDGGLKLAHNLYEQLPTLREEYDYVVATKDFHPQNLPGHFEKDGGEDAIWPVHCVAGTHGADLALPLREELFDAVFEKGQRSAAFSGFEGYTKVGQGIQPLIIWLAYRQVVDIDVCGLATDYCVKATALDAFRLGYNTAVRQEFTEAVGDKAAALEEMRRAGVFVD